MSIRKNLAKFREHARAGLLYALYRGIKYSIFLCKKIKIGLSEPDSVMLSRGKLSLLCKDCGIKLIWDGVDITEGIGLNVAVNTFGIWTNSTKAEWHLLEKTGKLLKFRLVFKELPMSQVWALSIDEEARLDWQIHMEAEEYLNISEFRVVCLTNPNYKSWLINYSQSDFPRLDPGWRQLYFDLVPKDLVGVRFYVGNKVLPAFTLESQTGNFYPFVQNPPVENNSHIIGFRFVPSGESREFDAGNYDFFASKLGVFDKDSLLDEKIELLRQKQFNKLLMKE